MRYRWPVAVMAILALCAAAALGGQQAHAASQGALVKKVKTQQRVIAARNAEITRLKVANRDLRNQYAEAVASMGATWGVVGKADPASRSGTLQDAVYAKLVEAQTNAALAWSVTQQDVLSKIAATPNGTSIQPYLSALCSRSRAGNVGWACSIFASSPYSSYTFDTP